MFFLLYLHLRFSLWSTITINKITFVQISKLPQKKAPMNVWAVIYNKYIEFAGWKAMVSLFSA